MVAILNLVHLPAEKKISWHPVRRFGQTITDDHTAVIDARGILILPSVNISKERNRAF
jgi:hypothetical protein